MSSAHPIVLFDGVCNYCNRFVNFAIRHDKQQALKFSPLQSAMGTRLRQQYHIDPAIDSVILIENDHVYTHDEAAFRIARHLNWPARALVALRVFPRFITRPVYKWIARNRYKWFGKKEACMVPSADVKSRFLE